MVVLTVVGSLACSEWNLGILQDFLRSPEQPPAENRLPSKGVSATVEKPLSKDNNCGVTLFFIKTNERINKYIFFIYLYIK